MGAGGNSFSISRGLKHQMLTISCNPGNWRERCMEVRGRRRGAQDNWGWVISKSGGRWEGWALETGQGSSAHPNDPCLSILAPPKRAEQCVLTGWSQTKAGEWTQHGSCPLEESAAVDPPPGLWGHAGRGQGSGVMRVLGLIHHLCDPGHPLTSMDIVQTPSLKKVYIGGFSFLTLLVWKP